MKKVTIEIIKYKTPKIKETKSGLVVNNFLVKIKIDGDQTEQVRNLLDDGVGFSETLGAMCFAHGNHYAFTLAGFKVSQIETIQD